MANTDASLQTSFVKKQKCEAMDDDDADDDDDDVADRIMIPMRRPRYAGDTIKSANRTFPPSRSYFVNYDFLRSIKCI